MQSFEFNDIGVCLNPNKIFKTTSKDKRYPYTDAYFTIETAMVNGKWVFGRDYNLSTYGSAYAAAKYLNNTYPTEKSAIRAACMEIKEGIARHVLWAHSNKMTSQETKLVKLVDEVLNPVPIQLSLF